ncbi:MAG: YkvA family protein [Verrucomicrobiota bacterium]
MVKCRQFHVRQWSLAEGEQRSVSAEPKDQRFVIIGVVEGIISCGGHRFEPGDFFLVPAFAAKELMLQAESAVSLLHTTIPEGTTDPRMALEPGRSDRRNVSPSPPIPTPERSMDPQNSPPSLTPPMETPPPPLDQSKHEGFYRELRAKMLQWAETKAGGNHPWMNYLLLAPDLFHLLLNLAADRNVPGQQKLMLGGVITYFVLPIDLFPEGIFGPVGFLDDVALASFALHQMMNLVDPETVRRHWAGELDSLEKAREVALRADELLGSGLVRRLRKQFGV